MDYTTSRFYLIILGYSEIDHIHLSSEAQCVSHHLPQVDCHTHYKKIFNRMRQFSKLGNTASKQPGRLSRISQIHEFAQK